MSRNVKGTLTGLILLSASFITIVASAIYLHANSLSNASLLKDSVAILFLNDADEKVFGIVKKLMPSWVKRLENDTCNVEGQSNHAQGGETSIELLGKQIPLRENNPDEASDSLNNNAEHAIEQGNRTHQVSTSDGVAEEQGPFNEDRSNAKTKASNDDDVSLRSLVLNMQKEREIETLLMLQTWTLLSREHLQSESNNFSARQVKAQELDTKIRYHCQHLCGSRRISFNFFENKESSEESATSCHSNDLRQCENYSPATATKKAEVTNDDPRSYSKLDQRSAGSQSEVDRCDNELLFQSMDLELCIESNGLVHKVVLMEIETCDCSFDGDTMWK